MAKTPEKVAFAENVITVHVKRTSEPGKLPDGSEAWDVESRILTPGETLPLSELPPYLSEAVLGGKVPGLNSPESPSAEAMANMQNAATTVS